MLNPIALLVLPGLTNTAGVPAHKPAALRTDTACALATRAEIRQELAHPVGNGKEDLTGPGAGCTFSGSYGEVTFTVQRPEQRLDIAAEVETLKASFAGATVREIAGLGTSAYLLEIGDSGAQVHVIRGEHDYLMVSVPGFGNAERVAEIAEALARKALARI